MFGLTPAEKRPLMPKAKHAHTPSTSSPESSVNDERLSRYYCNLDGGLLTARSALALIDMLAERERLPPNTSLCLIGISDTLGSALNQLQALADEMGVASGDIDDCDAPPAEGPPAPQEGASAWNTPDRQAIEDLHAVCDLLEALAVANHAQQFRIRRRTLLLLRRAQQAALDRLSTALSHTAANSIADNGALPKQQGSMIDA
jgi:hypothetical protein